MCRSNSETPPSPAITCSTEASSDAGFDSVDSASTRACCDLTAQWWRDIPKSQVCPLSGFPIPLLPYPPFRFRLHPHCADKVVPVDGKFLVLHAMASGNLKVCGRQLGSSDISALDTYIRRCNLGRLRLGSVLELQKIAASPATSAGAREATKMELNRQAQLAQKELEKLKRIQETRLKRIQGKGAPQTSQSPQPTDLNMQIELSAGIAQVNLSDSRPPVSGSANLLTALTPAVPLASSARQGLNPDNGMSWDDNVVDWTGEALCSEHWRHYSLAAKDGDDIVARRLENASWRLWVSGSHNFNGCIIHAQELLKWMDSQLSLAHLPPQLLTKPTHMVACQPDSDPESDLPSDFESETEIGGLLLPSNPKDILRKWQTGVSLMEKRIDSCTLLDGQSRSRKQNWIWRNWALSHFSCVKPRATRTALPKTWTSESRQSRRSKLTPSEKFKTAAMAMSRVILLEDRVSLSQMPQPQELQLSQQPKQSKQSEQSKQRQQSLPCPSCSAAVVGPGAPPAWSRGGNTSEYMQPLPSDPGHRVAMWMPVVAKPGQQQGQHPSAPSIGLTGYAFQMPSHNGKKEIFRV